MVFSIPTGRIIMKPYVVLILAAMLVSCASTVSLHFDPVPYSKLDCPVHPHFKDFNVNKIAVLPFQNSQGSKHEYFSPPSGMANSINVSRTMDLYSYLENDGAMVSGLFEEFLVSSYMFDIVDRRKLEDIFREQGLQLSGAVDEDKIVNIGKLAGADAILSGSVIEAYTYKMHSEDMTGSFMFVELAYVTLEVRLVHVETGKVLWNCTISRNSLNFLNTPLTVTNQDIMENRSIPMPGIKELVRETVRQAVSNLKAQ